MSQNKIFYHVLYMLIFSSVGYTQTKSDSLAFKKQLQSLHTYGTQISNFNWYPEAQSDDAVSKKFDRLTTKFAALLERILQQPQSAKLLFKNFENISVAAERSNRLRLITWRCPQQGTGFDDSHTIVQYKSGDSLRVFALPERVTNGSWNVYRLKHFSDTTLYLGIGIDETSREGNTWSANIFGVDTSGVFLKYSGFPNHKSSIVIGECSRGDCDGESDRIEFNPRSSMLTVSLRCCDMNKWKKLITTNHLYRQGEHIQESLVEENTGETTKLKFNGRRFVVFKHPTHE